PHPHIERDAGAGGLLVEDHGQHPARQRRVRVGHTASQTHARGFPRLRLVDNAAKSRCVVIRQIEEMLRLGLAVNIHYTATLVSSAAAAFASNATPSRASASVRISGGSRRTTLSPAGSTMRPASRAAAMNSPCGTFILRPSIMPSPRTLSKIVGWPATSAPSC